MIENLLNKYQELAPNGIVDAIKSAADKTGVDFDFLMEKASAESNFDAKAEAKTSSATGLFQFIDNTWLDMVKRHGEKYGLGNYAKQIECRDGKLCVNDVTAKDKILELRKDPKISSMMAAEFTAENKEFLKNNTNSKIGSTELYLAHFMGARGASNFINERMEKGSEAASDLFIKEARANKNVFFDNTTGKARSLDEVYNFFDKKFSSDIDAKAVDTDTKDNRFRQQGNTTTVAYLTHTHAISPVAAPVHSYTPQPSHTLAQAPLFFNLAGSKEDYITDAMLSANEIYAQSMLLMAQDNLHIGAYS